MVNGTPARQRSDIFVDELPLVSVDLVQHPCNSALPRTPFVDHVSFESIVGMTNVSYCGARLDLPSTVLGHLSRCQLPCTLQRCGDVCEPKTSYNI